MAVFGPRLRAAVVGASVFALAAVTARGAFAGMDPAVGRALAPGARACENVGDERTRPARREVVAMPDAGGAPTQPPAGPNWLQRIFGLEPRRPRRYGPDGELLDPRFTPATNVSGPSAPSPTPPSSAAPPPAAAPQPPAGPNWLQRIFGLEPRRPRRYGPDGELLDPRFTPVGLSKPVPAAPAPDRAGGMPGVVLVGGLVLIGAIATVAVAVLVGSGESGTPTGASGVAGASGPSGATGPVAMEGTSGPTSPSVPATTSPPAPCAGCGGAPAGGAPTETSGPGGIPASCLVTADEADLALADAKWTPGSDGLTAGWSLTASNAGPDLLVFFLHKLSDANAATKAGKWKPDVFDWFEATSVDSTGTRVNLMGIPAGQSDARVAGADGQIYTSVEPDLPTLCFFEYTDRVVIALDRPGCSDELHKKLLPLAADPVAQNELMMPWSVEAPIPDQMNGWSCPE